MRLLTVGNMYPPHHYGGYELVWKSAVDHLVTRGHEVRVLTTSTRTSTHEPDPPFVFRDLHWPLVDGDFQPLSGQARISLARHNHRTLERHLRLQQPQVVAWWSMGGLTLTMLETVRRQGLPAVAFVHDDWLDYGRWADGWLNMFRGRRSLLAPIAERLLHMPARVDFGRAASYLFVSRHTCAHAELQGLGLRRTAIAHSGINADFLQPAEPSEWRYRLLYVGRLDPRKGVDTAIDALSHLPRQARLVLAGGGWDSNEDDRLRRRVLDMGLDDRVEFLGQLGRAQTLAAYAEADAVIFPGQWEEPWGLVPLEAMGRGRPVVATGRGGSAEYLRDEVNCLLFTAGDSRALAAAIMRLAAEPELRAQLREEGLRTAPRHTEMIFNRAVEEAIRDAAASIR